MADQRPVRLLSQADIGAWFGVSALTVAQWRKRFPSNSDHPFPCSDFLTGMDAERDSPPRRPVPGWLPEREEEIRAWYAARPGQGAGGGRPHGSRLGGQLLADAHLDKKRMS